MEKAREARAVKAMDRKAVLNGDRKKIAEAASILRKVLEGISPVFGDGRLDRGSCSICERTFVPSLPNDCVCQEGWRFVESVKEVLDGQEGH